MVLEIINILRYFVFLFSIIILLSCNSENNNQKQDNVDTVYTNIEDNDVDTDNEIEIVPDEVLTPDIIWNNPIRVYIDDKEGDATNVRDGIMGEIIFQLEPSDGYEVFICGVNNGWFITKHIDVLDDEGDDSIIEERGYIHASVLAAGTRNYGSEKINLYSNPSDKSEIVFTLTQESQVRLIDGNNDGKWLKVSWHNNGNLVTGWIQSSWLCGSLRTNCC